ncbi:MAG: hypothetical protein HXY50_00490 [Ignavibacteriaceae bacterium]|nr:hypothetical protein [Ignavibacteriaceae bacterium]
MADKDPTIPFYAQDFLVDTIQLPEKLVGAYIRLLCVLWVNKFCYYDATQLAMISPSAKEVVDRLKSKFSFHSDNTFTSNRLEEVRTKREEIRSKRQNAGLIGSKGRWQKDNKVDSKNMTKVTETETVTETVIENEVRKWNEFAKLNNLPRVVMITDKRKSSIKARLSEDNFNLEHIFQRILESDFLLGKSNGFRASFDFVFEGKNNYVKILEGVYSGNNKGNNGASPQQLAEIVSRRLSRE